VLCSAGREESMDIHGKSMDMDMGVKFYSHGKPEGTLGEKVQNHIMEWR